MEQSIYNFRKELQGLGYSKGVVNSYPKYAEELLNYSKESPQKITGKHIKDYYQYLKTRPNKRRKTPDETGLSQSYIHSQMLGIKRYFEYLVRIGKIKQSPCQLKIKRPIRKERTVLMPEEIQALYRACRTLKETVIIHLCYGCGLRRSEAEQLNAKDIDYENKLLFVRRGKGKKRRVIPLTSTITKDFKKYNAKRKSPSLGGVGEAEAFLLNSLGNRMKGNTLYLNFKKILKRTELSEDFTLHNLRHSIATHLLENGMSIEMVRDFLGHSTLVTTQIYTRINLLKNQLK